MFNIWVYLTFAYLHTWKIVGMKTFAPSLLPTQLCTTKNSSQLNQIQFKHIMLDLKLQNRHPCIESIFCQHTCMRQQFKRVSICSRKIGYKIIHTSSSSLPFFFNMVLFDLLKANAWDQKECQLLGSQSCHNMFLFHAQYPKVHHQTPFVEMKWEVAPSHNH